MKGYKKLFILFLTTIILTGLFSCKTGTDDNPGTGTCTITYYTEHGKAPASVTLPAGSSFTENELKEISCDYLIFDGWYIGNSKVKAGNSIPEAGVKLTAKWNAEITYTGDPDYGDIPDSIIVPEKTVLTSEQLPVLTPKNSTTFSGWIINGVTINEKSEYKVLKNLTLTAGWGASITYKSDYEIEGFSFNDSEYCKTVKIEVGTFIDINYLRTPSDSNFIGWIYNSKLITEEDSIKISGPVQLIAAWKPDYCVINFVSDKGGYAGENKAAVKKGTKILDVYNAIFETMDASDYVFEGWYADEAYPSILVEETETVTTDITVYARWAKKTITVTFNSNNGKNQTEKQTFEYNVAKPLTENSFENSSSTGEKYIFTGWSLTPAETSDEDVAINYSNKQIASFTEDIDLYAVWNENRVAPALADSPSGSYSPGKKITLVSETDPTGADVEIYYSTNGTTPNRNSTKYDNGAGITLSNTGDTQIIKTIVYDGTELGRNKSIVATYNYSVVCKIEFKTNLPSSKYTCVGLENKYYPYGSEIQLNQTLESHGLEFLGWSEEQSATTPKYTKEKKLNLVKDTVLYAVWTVKQYEISYNKGDYGSYLPESKTVEEDYVLNSVDLCKLTSAYATFNGWTDQLGNKITAGYVVNRNITLIADWIPILYTISYDCGGKTTLPDVTNLEPGMQITSTYLPVLNVDGYYFDGWEYTYEASDGETSTQQTVLLTANQNSTVKVNKNIILKAKFHRNYKEGDLVKDMVYNPKTGETQERVIAYIFREATAEKPALGIGTTGIYYGYYMYNPTTPAGATIYSNLIMRTVAYFNGAKDGIYYKGTKDKVNGDETGADNFNDIYEYLKLKNQNTTTDDVINSMGPFKYAAGYGIREDVKFNTEVYRSGWFPPSLYELAEIVHLKVDVEGSTEKEYMIKKLSREYGIGHDYLGSCSMSAYKSNYLKGIPCYFWTFNTKNYGFIDTSKYDATIKYGFYMLREFAE